jgi:hypothetical protein
MKHTLIILASIIFLFSCNSGEKTPDVSNIKVDFSVIRFEKDFFAVDTNNIDAGLTQLEAKEPAFFKDFLGNILGVDKDMMQSGAATGAIKSFIRSYKPLYDSANIVFGDFAPRIKEIKKVLQFAKHYFPNYKLPLKLITFIGPMDASYKTSYGVQGDILTADAVGIGLQLHMGKNFSFYQSKEGQTLYPEYISKQFEPDNIAVDVSKNVVDDLFPEKLEEKTLIQQMVEKGKRLYALKKLCPHTEEYQLIGYTPQQLKESYDHEKYIWDLFVQNNLLQTIDENIIKNYIGTSPKTQELGDASPGNIGSFAGWQIVKKYMEKNPGKTLQQLMIMDADIILQEAKYKP